MGDVPPPLPPLWQEIKKQVVTACRWLAKIFVAPGIALVVIAIAVLLIVFGFKNVQIGGLLGKLFGKKNPEDRDIDIANTVPEDRIDKDGKIILQGQPDSKGITQAVVVPIENPGLFSNPSTVSFKPPGGEKPVEIKLPDGVRAKDVDKVVVIKQNQFVVMVKDSSGIKAEKIDSLINKYQ
jgi:hypothetical protein